MAHLANSMKLMADLVGASSHSGDALQSLCIDAALRI